MGTLTKDGFTKTVQEDIEWLKKQPRTLERDHILLILERVPCLYYDKIPNGFERWVDTMRCDHANRYNLR